jgi:hypothetical protein
MAYELPKKFLSASQINKYLGCGKAYEFEYVNSVEVPRKINQAITVGKTVHKYVEQYIHKLMEGEVTGNELAEMLSSTNQEVEEICFAENIQLDDGVSPQNVLEYSQKLALMWHKEIGASILPIKSESKFESVVGDVPVMGFIDYVDIQSGNTEIVDLKVVDKTKTLSDAKNSIQLAMYSIVENTPAVRFDSLVKTKVPKLTQVKYSFSSQEWQYYTDLIGEVATNITKGNFPRTNPTSWNCTNQWCDFYSICRGK